MLQAPLLLFLLMLRLPVLRVLAVAAVAAHDAAVDAGAALASVAAVAVLFHTNTSLTFSEGNGERSEKSAGWDFSAVFVEGCKSCS